jgi:tetratricopeptide (TPR) repeat protein
MTTRENAAIDVLIAGLSAAAQRYPRKIDTWVSLGRAWVTKARETSDPGYFLNADACAEIALDLSPGDKRALDLRGMVLLNDHKFGDARDLARSMLDADHDNHLAWGTLSDALLELGDLEQADEAAQRMMDLKPSLPSYARVSYFQWLAGNTPSAVESIRLAIDAGRDPKHPEPQAWALVQAAMLFWQKGDYDGADAGFARALEILSDYPPALVGRGRVAMARDDAKLAARLYESAYLKTPLTETAWLLGEARALSGDQQGAEEAYAWAETEGQRADRRTLSLMYSARSIRAVDALRLAETERRTRGDIYTEDALAWALYRNGRFAEAKPIIEHARRYGTRDARLMFHQGAIEVAAGNAREGKKLLRQALQQNPKFDVNGSREANKLLEER